MGLSHDETLCMRLNLQLDCRIHVIAAKPKQSGAAKARWDRANIPALVGQTVSASELVVRGLTMADIRHELRTDTRLGFQHVCNKWWRQQGRRQRP